MRRISRVRYAACKLAAKSARRPKELDGFETWDELSLYKIRSSVGAEARGPSKVGANEVAGGGQFSMEPGRGSRLGPRSPQVAGVLIQARGPQRDKHCSSRPRRGEWLGPQDPPTVGALLQARGPQGGKHYSSRPRRGEWLEPQNPSAMGALLQTRRPQEGDLFSQNHATRRVQTAGIYPSEQGGDQLQLLSQR